MRTIFSLCLLLISTNLVAWETSYGLALPGSNPQVTKGDEVFNYLFSPDLVRKQNAQFNNNNNSSPPPKPSDNPSTE